MSSPGLFRLALCVALCVAAITGCSDDQSAKSGSSGPSGTLVIGLDGEPDNLNPVFGDVFGSYYGDHLPVFDSLLDYDRELNLQPTLAAALPQVSADGLTITVPLRDGVRWHDGQPFSAADVVFTYRSIMDPKVATELRDNLFDALASVDAVDPRTVRFSLRRVDPAFPDKLTFGVVPEHLLAGQDLNKAPFNFAPVGTGPFRFEALRKGESMTLRANPDYFGGPPGIDRVIYAFIPDQNVRATRLRSGELDVDGVSLPPRAAAEVAETGRVKMIRIPGESKLIFLPENNPLFADPVIRRAIGLAVDRKAIAEGVFAGAAQPSVSPIAAGHWADAKLPIPARDVAAAGRLLDEAGWVPGPDGVRRRGGQVLAFPLIYPAGEALLNNTALALRDQLAEVGMRVEPEGLGFKESSRRQLEGTARLSVQVIIYDPELTIYRDFHSSFATDDGAFTDPTRMVSPAVDKALVTARSTADRSVRAAAYADLQRALIDEGSYVYLVQGQNSFLVSDRVKGVAPQVHDSHVHGFSRGLLWNLHDWRLAS